MKPTPALLFYLPVALLATWLSGCASAAREDAVMLRDKAPILVTQTDKAVDSYIGCLHPKLIAIRPPVELVRDGDSTALRITSFANPVLVVTVSPRAGGGSDIALRARMAGAKGVSAAIDAANSCR